MPGTPPHSRTTRSGVGVGSGEGDGVAALQPMSIDSAGKISSAARSRIRVNLYRLTAHKLDAHHDAVVAAPALRVRWTTSSNGCSSRRSS